MYEKIKKDTILKMSCFYCGSVIHIKEDYYKRNGSSQIFCEKCYNALIKSKHDNKD
jgi:hypothetical protein